ncbi:MAG: phosphoribosylamine--glycine ligase [Bacteroidota bacterium]
MKILVVGSGGREHALAWKLKQSPNVTELYCAPGNAGTMSLATNVPVKANDIQGLLKFVKSNRIDLTVVGPEVPLTEGIVDIFEPEGLSIFGPTKLAAEIEGSKVFSKNFMKKYSIPTAAYAVFSIDQRREAEQYVGASPLPCVVKADGLAAGKGAVICESRDDALKVIDEMMGQKIFGSAGERIVVEEFLTGEEASVFALSDGENFALLSPAQDHKRILDGDQGKNTGGMGAYAPAPVMTAELMSQVESTIIIPTIKGMAAEGRTYRGCLYVGIMVTSSGPKVVEYNCRLGDPEAQVVLPLIDGDLADIMMAVCHGNLKNYHVKLHDATAVCVIIASRGYPDKYDTGKKIYGLDASQSTNDVVVFHSGTRYENGDIVSSGGRVLGVTAIGYGHGLERTIRTAYSGVRQITFDGAYYRSDIGQKGLRHLRQ